MKLYDTLNRRTPHSGLSSGITRQTSPRDIEWYEFLHSHGPLPTSFLHAYTAKEYKNHHGSQIRLGALSTDLKRLDRLRNKIRSDNPWADELVYTLNDNSISILEGHDRWSEFAPKLQPPYEHMLMCSSITASLHIGCNKAGHTFLPQQKVIQAPLQFKVTLDGKVRNLNPDGACAIVKNGKRLNLFLEADRGTEPSTSHKYRSNLADKISMYVDVFDRLDTDVVLLFVTISEAKRRAFLQLIKDRYPKGRRDFLTHVIPTFGEDYKIPRPFDLLDVSWQRCEYPAIKLG